MKIHEVVIDGVRYVPATLGPAALPTLEVLTQALNAYWIGGFGFGYDPADAEHLYCHVTDSPDDRRKWKPLKEFAPELLALIEQQKGRPTCP